MSSTKSLIINCGASHVAAAVFSSNQGQLVLENLVTHDLAYDFTVEEAWLKALADALRELGKSHSWLRGKATFILPGYQLFTKPIKVPHVEAGKQTQIIAFEAQNNMPFPINEVVWGSQVIADDGVETEVILIAQKSEQANRFCGMMKSCGLEPVSLEPASILDYNAYRLAHSGEQEDTLLVNIGARSTNLTFVSPAGFFVRNINLGGNAFTQMVADGLGKPFGQAEEIKVAFYSGRTSFDPNDPAVAPLQQKAQEFMRKLTQEITRSIVTYRRASSRAAPARILLTGRGGLLHGLSEFLCESQKVSVDYLNPTTVLQFGAGVDQAVADQVYYQVSEVVGAAAGLVLPDAVGVNLLPTHISEGLRFGKQKPFVILAAICLALAPAAPLVLYRADAAADKASAAKVQQKTQQLQGLSSQIADESAQAHQIRAEISQFEGLVNSRSNWILFFSDLQNILVNVKDVWLDQLTIDREQAPAPQARSGMPAPPPPPPVYKLEITGRMLLRDYDPNNPGAFHQDAATKRVQDLLNSFTTETGFVKSVDQDYKLDFTTDRRLVQFSCTLEIDPNKPL
ncbi:MAG: pilus assembly protein PilM [Opitutales bacterium]|jgi:type IV pilus assembly protein PilM